MAIVGAYVLAGELSRPADVAAALAAYERIIRPFVEKALSVTEAAHKMDQPQTRLGVALQRAIIRFAAAPGVGDLVAMASEAQRDPAPFYRSPHRPSIDPDLLIRMLLVAHCFDVRSERRPVSGAAGNELHFYLKGEDARGLDSDA